MQAANLVIIMSDQHNKRAMGCAGHPLVHTPHLDRLAASGVRFTNAYCNSPMCVPSRASFATGRYVHETNNWDNAAPYDGATPSWGHRLTAQGHRVVTIGKLHYRDEAADTGFPDQRMPMHVNNGTGDLHSLIRENMAIKTAPRQEILNAGEGETSYIRYDCAVAAEACRFLRTEAKQGQKPWVLFVSLVTPHFPLKVPKRFLELYPPEKINLPLQYSLRQRPQHPVLVAMNKVRSQQDEYSEMEMRRAIAAYYGLCSFMDEQVGSIMQTLEAEGLGDHTRILYTSDHGDSLGDHGMWYKCTMYEGSVGVPLIMSGPDLPRGRVVEQPVSLIDAFPTIVEAAGGALTEEDRDLPGRSLFPLAQGNAAPDGDRIVYSEYHSSPSITGMFMIRSGPYKYVYYAGYAPQLFHLTDDPDECVDLAGKAEYAEIVARCHAQLREIVDPDQVDRLAKADQLRRIELHGGRAKIMERAPLSFSPAPEKVSKGRDK